VPRRSGKEKIEKLFQELKEQNERVLEIFMQAIREDQPIKATKDSMIVIHSMLRQMKDVLRIDEMVMLRLADMQDSMSDLMVTMGDIAKLSGGTKEQMEKINRRTMRILRLNKESAELVNGVRNAVKKRAEEEKTKALPGVW
jgi:hypothetical protein